MKMNGDGWPLRRGCICLYVCYHDQNPLKQITHPPNILSQFLQVVQAPATLSKTRSVHISAVSHHYAEIEVFTA
jgi:hypothetical protein